MDLYVSQTSDPIVAALENCILSLDGVVKACVWVKDDKIMARLTVTDLFGPEEAEVMDKCRSRVGTAPHLVMLERAIRLAA